MRKKHAEHANHERWLVSYADFITLLFAFFVVMFAISQVDARKLGRFVESVNVAFTLKGPFPDSSTSPIPSEGAGIGIAPALMSQAQEPIPTPTPPPAAESAPSERRTNLEEQVQQVLRGSALADRVKIRTGVRGVTVSLSEAGFFDVGSATVRPDSVETLRMIAEALRADGSPIAVEGHTDNKPIHTPRFASNWELAAARATTIVRYLVDEMHYDPARLAATGYAEFRPLGDNQTVEGRAQNRRVDIVVLTEHSEGPVPD